ncbi:hypothetical protein CIT37_32130 [Bradyrhizobium ottawaense]|uniref:Uncharacterized protein n=1 Tax=Bradyrhizobium ottawaense TaxID=931866 RepID=A0A2U8PFZ7_9BRAD|nr:hypothetical protein [Bradyrhizobium ottawaense]AWL96257.1 hypothetical protein CIT37_32130 [Bradyrhizobium ottawaense]
MRFKSEQHFRMADRLSCQSINELNPKKRERLEAMARVFRRLAVNAYMATDADMKRREWSKFNVDTTLIGLIDPPSPWDSLEEWQAYAAELDEMPPSKLVRPLLERAEETIVRKKLGLL